MAMGLVRFRIACKGRVEFHEVEGTDLTIGSADSCDLVIDHGSVAACHARVLLRRGRLLLVDAGKAKTGTTRGEERLRAPVALSPGESFGAGEVKLSAWSIEPEERGLVGRRLSIGRVTAELESRDLALRRYRVCSGPRLAELLVPKPGGPALDFWIARIERTLVMGSPRIPQASLLQLGEQPALSEMVPRGVRLGALMRAMEARLCRLPWALSVLMLLDVLDALIALRAPFGPHGALDPTRIHVGVDGNVSLMRPGPSGLDPGSIYKAPEHARCAGPSSTADLYALGVIARALLAGPGGQELSVSSVPNAALALTVWLAHADPACRPVDLMTARAAVTDIADALAVERERRHLGSLVSLLTPDFSKVLGKANPPV